MSQPIVVDIQPTGRVQGMHRDEFNLGFLGKQKITRASEIIHNVKSQKWEIHIPAGYRYMMLNQKVTYRRVKECGEFVSYNTARDFEVLWMNTCRMKTIKPGSKAGRALAARLHKTLS